jgi:hypothetical protein
MLVARRANWKLLFMVLGLRLSGGIFYGQPVAPEAETFRWVEELGAFLIFSSWALSTWSWGLLLSHTIQVSNQLALALGTLWMALLASGLGHLGWMGFGLTIPWQLLSLMGPLLLVLFKVPLKPLTLGLKATLLEIFDFPRPRRFKFVPLLLVLSVFALAILGFAAASMGNYFHDPLWYHLVGPRLWFEEGRIFFPESFLQTFQAGTWDYLHLWANAFLAGPQGGGLNAVQLFGQWTHFFLGFFPAGFVLCKILKKLNGKTTPWLALAVTGAMYTPTLGYLGTIAKNDWGIIFWILTAFGQWTNDSHPLRKSLITGLLVGAAFSSKFTAAFSIAPLFGWFLLKSVREDLQKAVREWAWVAMGFVVAVLPVLLRNFLYTRNPFFPAFDSIFHSEMLGPTWRSAMKVLEPSSGSFFSVARFMNLFRRWGNYDPGLYFWLSFLVLGIFNYKNLGLSRKISELMGVCLVGFACFLIATGSQIELRYLGALLFCLVGLSFLVAGNFIEILKTKKLVYSGLAVVLVGFVHFQGLATWKEPLELYAKIPPTYNLHNHPGGRAIWVIRKSLPPSASIAVLGDPRVYYLLDRNFVRVWDDAELDREISAAPDVLEVLRILKRHSFDYLVISAELVDNLWNGPVLAKIKTAIQKSPASIFYKDEYSKVVHISTLGRDWMQAQNENRTKAGAR